MDLLWEIYGMRKHKKLTQREFAEMLGFSRSAVNDIENMRRNPSESFLVSFNQIFHSEKTDEFYSFLDILKENSYKYPI
ncbi:helix-turn-helix domain-containing protein [Lysinibacillus sp. fkY74-1]|uniref:helix-turn-helix domain-containing protein n=1 Tax=Lysinibacillus sp. fls2-241-R2A-57 TaxID=3040292 RepID=UPI002555E337|nr:helix-turn-helix transcriptional regulator [Lysinibacillus sp. fls2-241-R2A-57]